MTYLYKERGKIVEADRTRFLGFFAHRFKLELRVVQNLLQIAESKGARELFVPPEQGASLRKKCEGALYKIELLLQDQAKLRHEQEVKEKARIRKLPLESSALATCKAYLQVQSRPIVDSALAMMRRTAWDGLEVTETGLQARGDNLTPESLTGTLAAFCAAKNGVDQTASIFAWAIGDAVNLAVDLGFYKTSYYPTLSQMTGLAVNHLKKMAHFSKIIPERMRIPGWPQSRYQQIVPLIRKATPSALSEALSVIAEADSERMLTIGEVKQVLQKVTGVRRKKTPAAKPRYLFVTPTGIWAGSRFLPSVARNPRSRVIDLEALSVLDAAQEVLYRIPPACAETSRDVVMEIQGFVFDEEAVREKEKMAS